MTCVGSLAGHEVWINLRRAIVAGRELVFYEVTSQVADHDLARRWLEAALPAGIPRTDAANFHCVLP